MLNYTLKIVFPRPTETELLKLIKPYGIDDFDLCVTFVSFSFLLCCCCLAAFPFTAVRAAGYPSLLAGNYG